MHWYDRFGMGYGHGIWGMIFMILIWIVVIAAILYIVKLVLAKDARAPETAEDILKKRYAGGEISKEEFERMKKDLLE